MSQIPPGSPPMPPSFQYQTPANKPSIGLAVGAMVVGIISIFPGCCFFHLGGMLILGIVAVVLGILARNAAASGRGGGAGMALAGLITGGIGLVLGLVLMIVFWVGGPSIQNRMNQILQQKQQQIQQQQQQQTMPQSPAQPAVPETAPSTPGQ